MIIFKGTLGPWQIKMEHSEVESSDGSMDGKFHCFSGHLVDSNRRAIAHVMGVKHIYSSGWVNYEQAEHNGHLIAAAPDLLEALKVCISHITAILGESDVPEMANVAIKKALNIK